MRECVFCGQPNKLTREHIIPQWLQDHLVVAQQTVWRSCGSHSRQHSFSGLVSRRVCIDCNTGWMSKLEAIAKPVLLSLLEEKTERAIPPDECAVLARWVLKTVFVLDTTALNRVVPDQHYRLLYEGKAPKHTIIAIAYCTEVPSIPSWRQNQNWTGASRFLDHAQVESSLEQTYRFTLQIGCLAARVCYFPLNLRLFEYENGIQYLHPHQRMDVLWPSKDSIDSLDAFDQSLLVVGSCGDEISLWNTDN